MVRAVEMKSWLLRVESQDFNVTRQDFKFLPVSLMPPFERWIYPVFKILKVGKKAIQANNKEVKRIKGFQMRVNVFLFPASLK